MAREGIGFPDPDEAMRLVEECLGNDQKLQDAAKLNGVSKEVMREKFEKIRKQAAQ